MSFKDVIKNSVLDAFSASDLFTSTIIMTLGLAALLGVYVYFIYRLENRDGFYSRGLNKTIALLPLITAAIVLAMQSNLVVSLGMVGALSIVRFRAAIKEPFEIVFLFWALAVGIVVGAGMFVTAVLGSIIIALVLVLFARRKISTHPYILVLSCANAAAEAEAMKAIAAGVAHSSVKAKTVTAAGIELSIEVTLKGDETAFVTDLCAMDGIAAASLVTYNGQFAD